MTDMDMGNLIQGERVLFRGEPGSVGMAIHSGQEVIIQVVMDSDKRTEMVKGADGREDLAKAPEVLPVVVLPVEDVPGEVIEEAARGVTVENIRAEVVSMKAEQVFPPPVPPKWEKKLVDEAQADAATVGRRKRNPRSVVPPVSVSVSSADTEDDRALAFAQADLEAYRGDVVQFRAKLEILELRVKEMEGVVSSMVIVREWKKVRGIR